MTNGLESQSVGANRVTAESVARLKQQVTDIKARMKDMTNAHDVPSIKYVLACIQAVGFFLMQH